MDYKKAINKIVEERISRETDARLLYLELLKSDNELYETEKAIRSLKMDKVKGKQVDENALKDLLVKRSQILYNKGVTSEMLNPPYKCEKCKDTGLIGGKPCSCVISKCANDSMIIQDATFANADIKLFPEGEQEHITSVYGVAKSFCDKFPATNKLNLLFMGKCGSGKTYLASCIGNEVSSKGYSVIMLSSFAFFNRMLKYHTTYDSDKLSFLDPLLDCDLLIIDDLGSENVFKNVTVEYLFLVINERMTANKHTIFTTNLDNEMIRKRYDERTYSRLFGSRQSIGFALSNTDLRKNSG